MDGALYALPILRTYGFVATFYVVAGRIGHANNLSWDQVAELAAAGMEIGDHTMQHVRLTRLTPARDPARDQCCPDPATEPDSAWRPPPSPTRSAP